MGFLTLDNIGLFIFLFLPGFISVKIHNLMIANEKYDFSKNLFEIIGYSLINIILFSWLILLNIHYDWIYYKGYKFFISIILILIIGPICWPIAISSILKSKLFKPHIISDSKSAWDFFFSKRSQGWIIVHLKDGRRIGGKFGKYSFASPYPCKESIYIQELWKLGEDNNFIEKIDRTNGMVIISDDILGLEFFN